MRLLRRIFGHQTAPVFDAPLYPEERLFVIGDVHGCAALLRRLIDKLDGIGAYRIVIVGDYVDRGEASAEVLAYLHAEQKRRGDGLVCLQGNHEVMMLCFVDEPEQNGAFWLRHGGLQTLASYGINPDLDGLTRARDQLVERLGAEVITWLRGLPLIWRSGNLYVTHAGMDPSLPPAEQTDRVLQWGHPDFGRVPRQDGIWVARGHVVVEEPFAKDGVIAVDTGAYAYGRLTAAEIGAKSVTFHSVQT